jgi:hypothetical protein
VACLVSDEKAERVDVGSHLHIPTNVKYVGLCAA